MAALCKQADTFDTASVQYSVFKQGSAHIDRARVHMPSTHIKYVATVWHHTRGLTRQGLNIIIYNMYPIYFTWIGQEAICWLKPKLIEVGIVKFRFY